MQLLNANRSLSKSKEVTRKIVRPLEYTVHFNRFTNGSKFLLCPTHVTVNVESLNRKTPTIKSIPTVICRVNPDFPYTCIEVITDQLEHATLPTFFHYASHWICDLVIDFSDLDSKYVPDTAAFKQLQSLTVLDCNSKSVTSWNFPNAAELLLKILANAKSLSSFSFSGICKRHYVLKWCQLELKLKTFSVKLARQLPEESGMLIFIASQRKTLERIYVHGIVSQAFAMELRSLFLNKLERLEFSCKTTSISIHVSHGNFPENLPDFGNILLPRFFIKYVNNTNYEYSSSPIKKSFETNWNFRKENPNVVVTNATQIFPILQKLEINAGFQNIFKTVAKLEGVEELTLCVEGVKSVDHVLMGLDRKKYRTLRKIFKVDYKAAENKYWKMLLGEPFQALNKLKVLTLKSNGKLGTVRPKITDIPCQLVLIKLKNLEVLKFCGSNSMQIQISEPVLQELSEKFLVSIDGKSLGNN